MRVLAIIVGILAILLIAQDGFETVVLPRRVARKLRITRLFYAMTWRVWSAPGQKIRAGNRREFYLGLYGPLSLLLLLILWASAFIIAFALLYWGLGSPLYTPERIVTFDSYLYMSGTTFFTLGLGDITPMRGIARFLVILEAGLGIGFLALVIGYVPVIYQVFSRRETNISLLDARAGSPPSALELLRRHYHGNNAEELVVYLREWERWCAELLESHVSYPVLAYYRSQHERQSWLAALTTILDVCALVIVGVVGVPVEPVKFTFAIARHAAVDLAQIFGTSPSPCTDRLSAAEFVQLREKLASAGILLAEGESTEKRLAEVRGMYEPFVNALASYLLVPLPKWVMTSEQVDDWQTSAWDHFLESSPHTLDRAMRRM